MSDWPALQDELEAWRASGRPATFWWRDDDATDRTPALERLLDLAGRLRVPVNLAVIPAHATTALAARLADAATPVAVLQHGFDHANHAPDGEKSVELGLHRPGVAISQELARGRAMLKATFGERAAPVLVPPWNRVAEGFVPELPGLGFRGLSTHTARTAARPAQGLVVCNTHLDVMRWRPKREFLGENEALDLLVRHLKARRQAMAGPPAADRPAAGLAGADPQEPSGLLTHHLVMDEAAWDFVARLLAVLGAHGATRWLTAEEAFHLPAESRACS